MAEHEEKNKEHEKKESVSQFRNNPWMISTIVLGILVVGIFAFGKTGITGFNSSLSESQIGDKAVTFINTELLQGQDSVTLVNVTEKSGVYEINVNYQGRVVPVYFTKDGKYFIQGMNNIDSVNSNSVSQPDTEQTAQEVTKSDKPKAELFVMSYCPYGTQAEKGLIPVLEALGSKIDGTIRFVHYTMHGDKETQENNRELCIREEQNSKFLPYMKCILNSSSATEPADVDACMKAVGVDTSKVNSCMESNKSAEYYAADSALSQQYGVQGSPTLIVNGVEVSSARDSASFLKTICSAFTTEPSECSAQLSSASPSPGFGGGTTSSGTAASCGA